MENHIIIPISISILNVTSSVGFGGAPCEAYYEDVKAIWEERFEKNYAKVVIMQSSFPGLPGNSDYSWILDLSYSA